MNKLLPDWHKEISEELAAARAALPAHESELAAATEVLRVAEAALLEAQAAAALLYRPSSRITSRLQLLQDDRNTARGGHRRAADTLKFAKENIVELEKDVRTLDR